MGTFVLLILKDLSAEIQCVTSKGGGVYICVMYCIMELTLSTVFVSQFFLN